jgi:hypothetical protein
MTRPADAVVTGVHRNQEDGYTSEDPSCGLYAKCPDARHVLLRLADAGGT